MVREEAPTADNRDSISEREQQVDIGNDADESALKHQYIYDQAPVVKLSMMSSMIPVMTMMMN